MPGLVYPLWGTDHYLKPAGYDVRGLAVRILHYLRESLDLDAPATRQAARSAVSRHERTGA